MTDGQLLDRAKTRMQETGDCSMVRPTLAEFMEIVSDLGIDPRTVTLYAGDQLSHVCMEVKRNGLLKLGVPDDEWDDVNDVPINPRKWRLV